jgi:hypothetical protein
MEVCNGEISHARERYGIRDCFLQSIITIHVGSKGKCTFVYDGLLRAVRAWNHHDRRFVMKQRTVEMNGMKH